MYVLCKKNLALDNGTAHEGIAGGIPSAQLHVRKKVCMYVCMYVYIPSHPAAKHTHINRKYVFMSVYVYM